MLLLKFFLLLLSSLISPGQDYASSSVARGGCSGAAATQTTHKSLIQETIKSIQGRKPVLESYGYDRRLRLTQFEATEVSSGTTNSIVKSGYLNHARASYSYDDLNRPVTLERYGYSEDANASFGRFDKLAYEYPSDNFAVRKIRDNSTVSRGHEVNLTTSGYTYNAFGAVTYDPYKKLNYEYNVLGLVSKVTQSGTGGPTATTTHRYSADGTLRETTETSGAATVFRRIYYVDGHRYDAVADEVLVAIPEGSTLLDKNNVATHIRYHADHLGNIILAFADLNADGVIQTAGAEVLEESRYYPYGLKFSGYARQNSKLPYAYNGAEEDTRYGLHLTTFRTMAPETALWGQTDPKAEWQYHLSPYSAMNGNPITYADPEGDIAPILIAAAIGAAIGGFGNLAYQYSQGNIENFGDGAAAFGIGAVAGGVGAASASFLALGGAALGTGSLATGMGFQGATVAGITLSQTSVASGAILGGVGASVGGPLRQGGNMLAGWQDKFDFGELGAEIGMGIAGGAIAGGIGRAWQNYKYPDIKGNIWTGNRIAPGRSQWSFANTPKGDGWGRATFYSSENSLRTLSSDAARSTGGGQFAKKGGQNWEIWDRTVAEGWEQLTGTPYNPVNGLQNYRGGTITTYIDKSYNAPAIRFMGENGIMKLRFLKP